MYTVQCSHLKKPGLSGDKSPGILGPEEITEKGE